MTTTQTISLLPLGEGSKRKTFHIAQYLVRNRDSFVAELASPNAGRVLKVIRVDKGDLAPIATYLLMKTNISPNISKLYYWAKLAEGDSLGKCNETTELFAYAQLLGVPLIHLFDHATLPDQFRQIIAQMALPLLTMHSIGFLHCDVKLENYVNAVRSYDDEWEAQSRFTTTSGRIFRLQHEVHGLDIKPQLIDFELVIRIDQPVLTANMVSTVHTRPPELLFVHGSKTMSYTEQSEAYSFGMSVLFGFERSSGTRWLTDPPHNFICDVVSCLGQNIIGENMLLAYDNDKAEFVAKAAWIMCLLLGYPGDAKMVKTPLGRVVKAHKETLMQCEHYNLLDSDLLQLHPCLDIMTTDLLRTVLRWKRRERSTFERLIHHPYFVTISCAVPPIHTQ